MIRRFSAVVLIVLLAGWSRGDVEPDSSWTIDTELEHVKHHTITDLGAIQGVSFHDGKIYIYGDVWDGKPRVGMIREYDSEFKPTGRVVKLSRDDRPLLVHPTGLTWHNKYGCFLGDTVKKKAKIYRFDWNKAWEDGNLDHAVRDEIDDDAAINGCRPEFTTVGGKPLLATSDYGDVHPEIRLYDPEKMLIEKRTSAPGVVVHRVLCGPFNQNLHWDADRGELTCVQNVVAGRGWKLDVLNLEKAVADGRAWGPKVRVQSQTLPWHNELEGYRPMGKDVGLFVTSDMKDNVTIGEVKPVKPRVSPAGK